jgi:hypothetical protein
MHPKRRRDGPTAVGEGTQVVKEKTVFSDPELGIFFH